MNSKSESMNDKKTPGKSGVPNSPFGGRGGLRSRFVPLNEENVDTDQIIPARFLKATTRDGFGKNLFRDWRYENNDETKPKVGFVLNQSQYKGEILVAGKNFGCGYCGLWF
jgi:3-isopropylmalate dehydratase small subunit